MALYWIPTSITQGEGKIFYRMEDFTKNNTKKNTSDLVELVNEINTARVGLEGESKITIGGCESAIYIS